jgi:dihydropteroate synthase
MFTFGKHKIDLWGVINITPDSFSDGGFWLDPKSNHQFQEFCREFDVLDLGAQSTAPQSQIISEDEEKKRLHFFEEKNVLTNNQSLSLDTYRPSVANWFNERHSIIWNDVSGVIDHNVTEWLKNPQHQYVLTFTYLDNREQTPDHFKLIRDDDILESFKAFLTKAEGSLGAFQKQVIIDPGFGFSKNREQNIRLLKNLPELIDQSLFPHWLIGLSRKSFLRFPASLDPKQEKNQKDLDHLQVLLIKDFLDSLELPRWISLRTHSSHLGYALKNFHVMMKV